MVFEERLHHSCNSPPVEKNQAQNATLAAKFPLSHFLANERETLGVCDFFLLGSSMTSFSSCINLKTTITFTGDTFAVKPQLWDH